MNKFEILKSNTIQFSVEMNQTRLSEFVIDAISEIDEALAKAPILSKDIIDKKLLKELKAFLKENKSKLEEGSYDLCMEEYREIKDDLEFRSTKQGRLILELEDWVKKNRGIILPKFKTTQLFIGRSAFDPKELIIGGIVKHANEAQLIKDFVNHQNPPVVPVFRLELDDSD